MVTTPLPADHAARSLDLLFSRLSWPSTLVAERACTALGGLLIHPAHSVETEEALFKWLGAQKLETVACLGLLVAKQVQIRGGELRRSMLERLTAATLPSFLSWLLLVELADRPLPAPDWTTAFSGAAPSDHEFDTAFLKSMNKFPPSMHYREWAERIEDRLNIPFLRQWDFEKQRILERFSIAPSDEALKFHRSESQPRHAVLDLPLGEVHRSAFLRALAWAHHDHRLPRDLCVRLAASLRPLDFGLWRVRPTRRPEWWPAPVAMDGPLDVAPAEIWSTLERELVPVDQGGAREWTLTQAQGPIRVGAATYDLSVWGIFQRCDGPEAPEPEVVADWCASLEALPWEGRSMVSLEGRVAAPPPDDATQRFADWQVAPAALTRKRVRLAHRMRPATRQGVHPTPRTGPAGRRRVRSGLRRGPPGRRTDPPARTHSPPTPPRVPNARQPGLYGRTHSPIS